MSNAKEMVCSTCGSREVRLDALAEWSIEDQCWELHSVYDDASCSDCEGETTIEERELP